MGFIKLGKGVLEIACGILSSNPALIGAGVKDTLIGGATTIIGAGVKEALDGADILTNTPLGDLIDGVKDFFDIGG